MSTYPSFDNDDVTGDGVVTWQHALDFVSGINGAIYPLCGAGYNDWRLPNIKELSSLTDFSQYDPALPFWFTLIVINEQSSYYWSSTTYEHTTFVAWGVSMLNGRVHDSFKTSGLYVWPVRGGQ